MVFIIEGLEAGERETESWDGDPANAAELVVTWETSAEVSYVLDPATSYEVCIDTAQAALEGYTLSPANAGGDSSNSAATDTSDSDATLNGSDAIIAYTTGAAGDFNMGLDFGFLNAKVPSLITGTSLWGNAYSITPTANATDGDWLVVEKHQPFSSTPAILGQLANNCTEIVNQTLGFCMDSGMASRTDPAEIGQYVWEGVEGVTNGGTPELTPLMAARVSYMFKQHPPNFDLDVSSANNRTFLQEGLHFIMGEGGGDAGGYGAEAIAAVSSVPTYTLTMTKTSEGVGTAIFDLVSDISPIELSVSDGGALPIVQSGTATLSGTTLTLTGSGVQTITLLLSRGLDRRGRVAREYEPDL